MSNYLEELKQARRAIDEEFRPMMEKNMEMAKRALDINTKFVKTAVTDLCGPKTLTERELVLTIDSRNRIEHIELAVRALTQKGVRVDHVVHDTVNNQFHLYSDVPASA